MKVALKAFNFIDHFGKYHNTLCLSPQILHNHCFQFLDRGTYNGPKKKQKQCLCKFRGDKQGVLWYFPKWPILGLHPSDEVAMLVYRAIENGPTSVA